MTDWRSVTVTHAAARCALLCAIGLMLAASCGPAGAGEFAAGGLRFSDELGGFRIVAISGIGTKADPIILEEEIHDTAPVTLVIRRDPDVYDEAYPRISLALTKIVQNRTGRVWGAFEMELQEIRDKPSGDDDGLSFSQMDVQPPDVSSDRFANNHRRFKPHDRIRFLTGHVDPDDAVRFSVVITDPTPVAEFFLVQDPQFLFSDRRTKPGQAIFARR